MSRDPSNVEYQRLLAFRDQLRRFVYWSEQQAIAAGIWLGGTGNWSDYGAGANQALQDIASGHEPRMPLDATDPDCD